MVTPGGNEIEDGFIPKVTIFDLVTETYLIVDKVDFEKQCYVLSALERIEMVNLQFKNGNAKPFLRSLLNGSGKRYVV